MEKARLPCTAHIYSAEFKKTDPDPMWLDKSGVLSDPRFVGSLVHRGEVREHS